MLRRLVPVCAVLLAVCLVLGKRPRHFVEVFDLQVTSLGAVPKFGHVQVNIDGTTDDGRSVFLYTMSWSDDLAFKCARSMHEGLWVRVEASEPVSERPEQRSRIQRVQWAQN